MSFHSVPLDDIIIAPDRQRKDLGELTELMDSIIRIGLLNPIIIGRDNVLIAGERRLQAYRNLRQGAKMLDPEDTAWDTILVHYKDELSPTEAQIIELDENFRRKDITWQETADAIQRIHSLYMSMDSTWTQTKTAEQIGLSAAQLYRYLRVQEDILQDARIAKAPTLNAAMLVVNRIEERRKGNALNMIADTLISDLVQANLSLNDTEEVIQTPTAAIAAIPDVESTILNRSCLDWMETYSGPRFNFIHCDFPYGIDYTGWDNAAEYQGDYADTPEIYWELLRSLAKNWDNIASPSCHFIFWFSMKHYSTTMEFFRKHMPQLTVNEFPLIWHKTDNRGTLPDPQRGPRRIYETAFFGYTEDRKIVKAISNTYGAPTQKNLSGHISEKPEPMLRHFFQMVVDDQTSILDPTCGGGSAIRAAESMGAKRSLGLELNPDHCAVARKRLADFRLMQKVK